MEVHSSPYVGVVEGVGVDVVGHVVVVEVHDADTHYVVHDDPFAADVGDDTLVLPDVENVVHYSYYVGAVVVGMGPNAVEVEVDVSLSGHLHFQRPRHKSSLEPQF